jgi:hypothetical protein
VPVPRVLVEALAEHLTAFPPVPREMDCRHEAGRTWTEVSLLIDHGESVKLVQRRLGHASATETLDTYAHLWPDSEDRTRDASTRFSARPVSQV